MAQWLSVLAAQTEGPEIGSRHSPKARHVSVTPARRRMYIGGSLGLVGCQPRQRPGALGSVGGRGQRNWGEQLTSSSGLRMRIGTCTRMCA